MTHSRFTSNHVRLTLLLAVGAAILALLLVSCGPSRGGRGRSGRFAKKECAECHADKQAAFRAEKVVHAPVSEGKCEACHLRHGLVGAAILKKESSEICYSCHAKEKERFEQAHVHTAIKDNPQKKKVSCTSCHNPHGSTQKGLLKEGGNALCFSCHQEAHFTKKVGHAPVTESCLTCHDPHASPQPDVLVKPAKALCQECHDVGASKLIEAHGGYPMKETPCASCHDPHTSTQPKLIREEAHPPMTDMGCDACHTDPKSKTPFATTAEVPPLCLSCHGELEEHLKAKEAH
jgi:predicted CXXCH cytochrome family protein